MSPFPSQWVEINDWHRYFTAVGRGSPRIDTRRGPRTAPAWDGTENTSKRFAVCGQNRCRLWSKKCRWWSAELAAYGQFRIAADIALCTFLLVVDPRGKILGFHRRERGEEQRAFEDPVALVGGVVLRGRRSLTARSLEPTRHRKSGVRRAGNPYRRSR